MQQLITEKLQEYLPEIDVLDINLNEDNYQSRYLEDLKQITENIHIWSHSILEKAKLPTAVAEAKALTSKYGLDTNEGCALQIIIELDAVKKSVESKDATTATLASMKLFGAVWHSSLFRSAKEESQDTKKSSLKKNINQSKEEAPNNDSDEALKLYQKTINELKVKYPHCNVNALRLLASTRLNVNKQELDDLDITPE